MALTAKERRELLAASHPLKPLATVSAAEVSEAVVEHVRAGFTSRPLLKIRVAADNNNECDSVASELVRRVPCELVKRVGRVVVLYRAPADE